MANQVYDPLADEEEAPIQGSDETTPVGDPFDPRGDIKVSDNPHQPPGDDNVAANDPTDPRGDDGSVPTTEQLQNAEAGGGLYNDDDLSQDELEDDSADDDHLASGFDSQRAKKNSNQNFFRRNRTKMIIGGGLFGGVGGIAAVLLLALIPLKIETIVNNLENRFFSGPQSAVQGMTQNLLQDYLVNWVIPDYKNCGSTVDRHCKVTIYSTKAGPVTNLFRAWGSERIENQLADNYGIELAHKPLSRTWYIKGPGISNPGGDNIGTDGSGLSTEFKRVDRLQFQEEVRKATSDLTGWQKLWVRYKIGRLESIKFGNKRYLFFNGTRNSIHEITGALKQAAKIELTQRVLIPLNATRGIALQCLLTDCDPTNSQPTNPTDAPDQNDFPESSTDTATRTNLVDLSDKISADNYQDILNTYNDMAKNGLQKYFVKQTLTPIIGEANASSAADKIPIIGWINLAAQVVNGANNAGPKIKKLSYAVNLAAAVNLWVMYRTYADEIHTGHVDSAELGSMTSTLSGGNNGAAGDPEVGGTASAEQSPVYNAYIANGGNTTTVASLFSSLLPAKASADSSSSDSTSAPNSKCANGSPIPSGQMVCSEEVLGGGNSIANAVHNFLNTTPVISQITTMASAWQSIFGPISNFIGDSTGAALNLAAKPANAICDAADSLGIPAEPQQFQIYCKARDAITKASPDIIKAATTALLPNPFGTNMSGGRTVEMMAAGADGAGNTYAQEGLGAKKVTPTVSAAIFRQQQTEAKADFEQEPFFARMFDTSSSFSLVSNLAMAIPLDARSSAEAGFASLLSNPLQAISNTFASIFSGHVSAATPTPTTDPFKIPQYAYTSMPAHPEQYWDQHCSDNAAQAYQSDADYNNPATNWADQAASTVDPDNGMPENTTTNPCLLIKAATGVDGGLFDQSLLTPDDLGDTVDATNSSSGSTTSNTTTTAGATIDMSTIDDDSTSVACAANTKDIGVYDGYTNGSKVEVRLCAVSNLPSSGEEANGGYGVTGADGKCPVNSRVSGAVYAMVQAAQQAGVTLTTDSCFRTYAHQVALQGGSAVAAPPGYSNHQMGLAMDFSVPICSTTISGQCSDPGNSMWDWLSKNAANFGYKSGVPSEAWHWSPTGN